jgi:hypothetical protein
VLVFTGAAVATNTDNTVGVGCLDMGFGNAFGFIAEVAVYNTKLSAARVAAHFAAASQPGQTPTILSSSGVDPNIALILASVRKTF